MIFKPLAKQLETQFRRMVDPRYRVEYWTKPGTCRAGFSRLQRALYDSSLRPDLYRQIPQEVFDQLTVADWMTRNISKLDGRIHYPIDSLPPEDFKRLPAKFWETLTPAEFLGTVNNAQKSSIAARLIFSDHFDVIPDIFWQKLNFLDMLRPLWPDSATLKRPLIQGVVTYGHFDKLPHHIKSVITRDLWFNFPQNPNRQGLIADVDEKRAVIPDDVFANMTKEELVLYSDGNQMNLSLLAIAEKLDRVNPEAFKQLTIDDINHSINWTISPFEQLVRRGQLHILPREFYKNSATASWVRKTAPSNPTVNSKSAMDVIIEHDAEREIFRGENWVGSIDKMQALFDAFPQERKTPELVAYLSEQKIRAQTVIPATRIINERREKTPTKRISL